MGAQTSTDARDSTGKADGKVAQKVKPRLRGFSHLAGFCGSVAACLMLVGLPGGGAQHRAGLVYGVSMAAMFGMSSLYHVPMWSHPTRALLRRFDHSGIFLFIAGTFTPLAVLYSGGRASVWLWLMWGGALLGIAYAIINSYGPRWIRSGSYVALGLFSAPVVLHLPTLIGWERGLVLLGGAALYVLGAVVYSRRWPNPKPAVFGFHEVFHLFVLAAAALQFVVIYKVQSALA